jgi:hypothetical protein
MRRAVERQLVSPLARQLAGVLPDTPSILEVQGRSSELAVRLTALMQSAPWPETTRTVHDNSAELLTRAQRALETIFQACETLRPPGEILATNIPPEFAAYLGVMELIRDTRSLLQQVGELLSAPKKNTARPIMQTGPRRKRTAARLRGWNTGRQLLKEFYSAEDVSEFCREIADQLQRPSPEDSVDHSILELLDRLALLNALVPDQDNWADERVVLFVRSPHSSRDQRRSFTRRLLQDFSWSTSTPSTEARSDADAARVFGLEATRLPTVMDSTTSRNSGTPAIASEARDDVDAVLLEGYRASRLALLQEGTHLTVSDDGSMVVYQVLGFPLAAGDHPDEIARNVLIRDEQCRDASVPRECDRDSGPFAWQPVVTFSHPRRELDIDFRYDRASDGGWGRLSRLLPLPPDFGI